MAFMLWMGVWDRPDLACPPALSRRCSNLTQARVPLGSGALSEQYLKGDSTHRWRGGYVNPWSSRKAEEG